MSVASSFTIVRSESLLIFFFSSRSSSFLTSTLSSFVLLSAMYGLNSRGVGFVFLDGFRWNLSTDLKISLRYIDEKIFYLESLLDNFMFISFKLIGRLHKRPSYS